MVASEILPILRNYFLNPYGFMALSALLPLFIFYLIKKKPDVEVMPSLMFFAEDKKSGKIKNAFRTLLRNLMLLLHILIVIGLAAALAHPYLNTQQTSEKTVLILDNSASMEGDLERAKDYIKSNTGEKNTLILVDDSVAIQAEGAKSSTIESNLKNVKLSDTRTNIVSALKTARRHEGDIVIGSDLDQTLSSEDTKNIIENLRNNDRNVKILDTEEDNSWGIIDVRARAEDSKIDIKNYETEAVNLEVDINGDTEQVSIEPESVETLSISTEKGKNTVELEEDSLEIDNKAFISIPKEEKYDVLFINDQKNRFLEKAFELIEFTDISTVNPPVEQDIDAEIYIVGKTDKILSETIKDIESDVKNNGGGLIVFSHKNVFKTGFNSLPVTENEGELNKTVSIQEPVRTTLSTKLKDVSKVKGSDNTLNSNGLVESELGKGKILFYNIDDRDFRHNFLYPIFWKRTVRDMMDRPTISDLNKRTGERIEAKEVITPGDKSKSGKVKLDKTGFYNASGKLYAANLIDEDESFAEEIDPEVKNPDKITSDSKKDIQNLASIVLTFILLGELAYLRNLGELS